ncbi:GNAT family N-acetyltransferase [Halovivax gelatinilyticus]|uniref:GNAT family N-acetyltransferase n=1 Tax=Halovivax gelatinilyticus TaxID=2961597 RepID=UPI0020CA5BA5|nr:GNAT family N-acetyltransferase [Halovivax gelatinilyticus]
MQIRRLSSDDAAVARYVEELWIPYHRDMGAVVESHELVEDEDTVREVTEYLAGGLDSSERYLWIAIEGASDPFARIDTIDGTFAGFLLGAVESSPPTFDWPDRFLIGDLFVRESYRGSGLAETLLARAADQAREDGCSELALDVDVDNERARAFYEKMGFETERHRMRLATAQV